MAKILTITPEGKVYLDGNEIWHCTDVAIKNINAEHRMEVEIRVSVLEVDVRYPGKRAETESQSEDWVEALMSDIARETTAVTREQLLNLDNLSI